MMMHLSKQTAAGTRPVSMVRLVDRTSGAPLRRGGRPLTLFTRDPAAAIHALLDRRDPALWQPVVQPLPTRETTE